MTKIAILLIAMMVISVGFLSGCNEQTNTNDSNNNNNGIEEDEKTLAELIIGNWKTDLGATKIYQSNGVFYLEFTTNDTSSGRYTLENNTLTEVYDKTGNIYVYLIEFYDENTLYEKNIETTSIAPLSDLLLSRVE